METSYHGWFIGPAAAAAIERAARAIEGCSVRVVEGGDAGAWGVLEVARFAEALAHRLGDGTWVWEVELVNDFTAKPDAVESHSGTLRGAQSVGGKLEPRAEEELHEEGFVRGGVMEEVAFEYVLQHVELATEPDADGAGAEPDVDGLAESLIDKLIATGALEVVNRHARRTLVEPIEACLSAPTRRQAAADVLATLVDAPEVVEIYADEAQIEALIKRLSG